MPISFKATREENDLIDKITERAMEQLNCPDRLSIEMDLCACNANGCKLDFAGLLEADDFDFAHDINGIGRHLSRTTGHLCNCFIPRYALKGV